MSEPPPQSIANSCQNLHDLIANHEDWLMEKIVQSIQRRSVTTVGTQRETWLSVNRLSVALLEAFKNHYKSLNTPTCCHYSTLIPHFQGIYAGLMQDYRWSYLELLELGQYPTPQKQQFQQLINLFFDQLEQQHPIALSEPAEVSLQNLSRHYTTLTQTTPVGIFRTDIEGNWIYVNPQASQMSGLSPDTALRHWAKYIHVQDRGRVFTAWIGLLNYQQPLREEYRYQHPDGKTIWVFAQAVPETDEDNHILGYVGTLTDITQLKKAEEDLSQTNAELKAIFDTFPDLFLRLDERGKILECKTSNLSNLFLLPTQILGQTIQSLLPPSAGQAIYRAIQKVLQTKSVQSVEYFLQTPGKKQYFEARLAPFQDREAIAIVRQITARKQAEIALRESEERLQTIIDTNANGLIVLDRQGVVLFVNPAAENLFGRQADRLIGEVLGVPTVTGEFTEIEILYPTGRLKIARMRLTEILWEGQQAYLAALTDITDLKQAQEKLKILYRASEQSPASIVITDAAGNIEYVNSKFEQVTGYTASELQGQNPKIFKAEQNPPEVYQDLWQTITAGKEWYGEFLNKKKNGELFWEKASISPIKDESGQITHYVAVKEDITDRKAQDAFLAYQANYDALTELPNRFLALDRLQQAIAHAERHKTQVGVLFVDLDRFKNVNDSLGHEYGDQLLQQVAKRLSGCLRRSDTVARLGGDEFLIVLPNLQANKYAKVVAQKILSVLEAPFDLLGEEAFVSASIGIAIYPNDGEDLSRLMRNADTAMYGCKRSGRNDFQFYTPGMNEAAQRRISLENQLHHALEKEELYVVYQPFIELKTGKIVGAEALMRWRNPKYGEVSPAQFIPIAEDTGLIRHLGAWILAQACQEAASWHRMGFPLWIAVNLSPRQFRDSGFLEVVTQSLENSQLQQQYLELEITEDLLLEDIPNAEATIEKLHQQKIRLVIDDFGTGYSSLSYLKKFPFSALKIDCSFVADLPHQVEAVSLVKTIIAMAHGLGLKAIAEGVETQEQLDFLIAQQCDYAQGYLIGRPLVSKNFQAYLTEFE